MSIKTTIHNTLVTAAAAGEFPEAVYSGAHPSLLSDGDSVAPASIEANEINCTYEIDEDYGISFRQRRNEWRWLLRLWFDTEVNLDEFERTIMDDPPVIPRDGDTRQVRLLMETSEPEHPPRKAPSNGTQVAYRFVAIQSQ